MSSEAAELGLIDNYEDAWTIQYEDLEFGEALGEGAFGAVYRGMYLGADVAIKRLFQDDDSPDAELFIQREINVLQGMRHPNIVQFIGIAHHSTKGIHIITEFIKAGDLRKLLKNQKIILSWLDRLKIAHSAACAMAYLHSRNIIHRDLKSKNLLVEGGEGAPWKVKICDFGFARTTGGKGARPMTLCGTDDWMAPEIILGDAYSLAADVFSFGIVLCEIITRKKISTELQRSPLDAFGLSSEKFQKLIPPDCPTDFSLLALDCCSHQPDVRPQFHIVVRRLKALIDTEAKKPIPVANPPAASSNLAKGRVGVGAGAGQGVDKFREYADKLTAMKAAGKVHVTSPASIPSPPVTSQPVSNPNPTPAPQVVSNNNTNTNIGNNYRTSINNGNVGLINNSNNGLSSHNTANNRKATNFGGGGTPVVNGPGSNNNSNANNSYNSHNSNSPAKGAAAPAPGKVFVVSNNSNVGTASGGGNVGSGPFYSYEVLRGNNCPAGLDRANLEKYLSDVDFQKVIGCTRTEWSKMPAWKQRGRKRELNLL
eukprot:TRINITY_DN10665_c0_g1_i1.p1 TRINITY_DN10665_c0_g1~~TRINITY_DN10665_c0_g1_i1.p1  ORF type:complete len:540 (+),score=158.07 TRINITY_DN10665_c0_g1_i1:360-1979(+)